jgi:hypothetical protein
MILDSHGTIPDITAFEKNGLTIIFSFQRPNPTDPTSVSVTLKAYNSNMAAISEFIFQAAVPKVRRGNEREGRCEEGGDKGGELGGRGG